MRRISDRHLHKVFMMLGGQPGAHLVSASSLMLAMAIADLPLSIIAEMLAAVVLVRCLYCLTRGPSPVLPKCRFRRTVKQVGVDEVKISVGLAAAGFLLTWPVAVTTVGTFVAVNLMFQVVMSRLGCFLLDRHHARCRRRGTTPHGRNILVVGTGQTARKMADLIISLPELGSGLAGFLDYRRRGLWRYRDIPLIGHPDEVGRIASNCQVDAVMIAVEPEDLTLTSPLFTTAEKMGIPVCMAPAVYRPSIAQVRSERLDGETMLVYRAIPENETVLAVKGLIDKLGALCVLILTMPLTLLSVLAIKIDSKGPVLFRQTRSGLNGRPFGLLKFRTMCHDAERRKTDLGRLNEMSGPVFKVSKDPRVTRIGRILRKTSIDELPQLLNVLKGDMSLVGPRPPLPSEVAQYEPWQHRRLSIKPGITCTWQVNGRNKIDFEEWMKLDMEYIDNWSLWNDAKILVKTIPAVLRGSGAS